MATDSQKAKVFDFIQKHPLGVIGTVGIDATPHLSAIYVSITNDLTCFAITKHPARKSQDIELNGRAALSFLDESLLTFVELQCHAEMIADEEQKRKREKPFRVHSFS